jgi:hypothetical protein
MIGRSLWSIKNIIKEKEDYIIINYLDLIKKRLMKLIKYTNF